MKSRVYWKDFVRESLEFIEDRAEREELMAILFKRFDKDSTGTDHRWLINELHFEDKLKTLGGRVPASEVLAFLNTLKLQVVLCLASEDLCCVYKNFEEVRPGGLFLSRHFKIFFFLSF